MKQYCEVAVAAPIFNLLTYELPQTLSQLDRGDSLVIPLGKRKSRGLIVSKSSIAPGPDIKIKAALDLNEERPQLSDSYLKWVEWLAKYYCYPLGQILELAFPPLKKAGRGSRKRSLIPQSNLEPPPPPTDEQQEAINSIVQSQGFNCHFLFGVTGSGKTEVYLQTIAATLEKGQTALLLVPEISLTPQLVSRFASRFGDKIAVLHSQLTEREKTEQWWQVVEGKKQILLGARSALFCPIPRLGVIVVDEEHESSFKQDEKLKYHARDAAIVRGKIENVPVLLGSATPSMESWNNVINGRYSKHCLSQRATKAQMPTIEVVDMRENTADKKLPFWLTSPLYKKIDERLGRKEQVALFLNRRGSAHIVLCSDCGTGKECPNCSVTLTLHGVRHLICHYCDYHESLSPTCSECGTGELKPLGVGTELIEEDIGRLFPQARIIRADRDEIQNREQMEDLIGAIENQEADILIGTQMIAKGLDFENLTLVGIILADLSFNLPDFRAAEKSFQLLTQVSGRAGRHSKPGEVVIQTYNPQHPSITHTLDHSFTRFAEEELATRQSLNYPPFGRLARYRFQGIHQTKVKSGAQLVADKVQSLVDEKDELEGVQVLGPAESPLGKLRGKHRHQFLIKATQPNQLQWIFSMLNQNSHLTLGGVDVIVDVDPYNML